MRPARACRTLHPVEAALPLASGAVSARARVVLADDHEPAADQLRRLLQDEFDIVSTVGDGLALVAAVEAAKPDVVVTDLAMPGLSGLSAARIIGRDHPAVRLVLVTVCGEPELVEHARALGVLGFVLKIDAAEDLVPAVAAARRGEPFVSRHARAYAGTHARRPRPGARDDSDT
jgi:DNA-binding NarL/FixJ family response regulator